MSSFELNLQAATAAVAAAEAAVASAKASLESLSRSANGLLAPEKQIMKRIPYNLVTHNYTYGYLQQQWSGEVQRRLPCIEGCHIDT